jgi:hypothetical protein
LLNGKTGFYPFLGLKKPALLLGFLLHGKTGFCPFLGLKKSGLARFVVKRKNWVCRTQKNEVKNRV